jgi:hypothetical protein
MAEYRQVYDFFFQQALPQLQRSIIPLYKLNSVAGIDPEFVGTSVYCQFGPFTMLLTAGHVLRDILPGHAIYPQPIATSQNESALPASLEEPREGRICAQEQFAFVEAPSSERVFSI